MNTSSSEMSSLNLPCTVSIDFQANNLEGSAMVQNIY